MPELHNPETLPGVIDVLVAGGVVLVPTDTVYGLAVHPEHDDAVGRLFAMKGRPRSVNLPVMVSSADQVSELGGVLTDPARRLLSSAFFPGPLTVALGICAERAPGWLAGRQEAAFRAPADSFLLAVLQATGPLLVTSANAHARRTPESVAPILAVLASPPDYVVDGGVRATVPSTLVNCRATPPGIERVGVISRAEIEAVLQ